MTDECRDHSGEVPRRAAKASTFRTPCVHLEVECSAMKVEGRALGPPRTNFNDYVGTAAADDAEAVLPTEPL